MEVFNSKTRLSYWTATKGLKRIKERISSSLLCILFSFLITLKQKRKLGEKTVTCYLSSSCHVEHKASTQIPPAISVTAICTSLQFFHPAFSLSLFAILLHVVLGLPRFCRSSGVQVNAILQSLFDSFLKTWPMNFHLLLRTSSLSFAISDIFRTSLFVILSCQRILNIRLRHLLWKTSILFSSHLFIFHVSQPYIKTGLTSVLYSLTLVLRLMLWLLQIFLNLKNTPLALTTLLWMSSVPPLSLETVAPKYTNLSTLSIPRPFTSTTSLFREVIRSSLHLSTLTFSPTLPGFQLIGLSLNVLPGR